MLSHTIITMENKLFCRECFCCKIYSESEATNMKVVLPSYRLVGCFARYLVVLEATLETLLLKFVRFLRFSSSQTLQLPTCIDWLLEMNSKPVATSSGDWAVPVSFSTQIPAGEQKENRKRTEDCRYSFVSRSQYFPSFRQTSSSLRPLFLLKSCSVFMCIFIERYHRNVTTTGRGLFQFYFLSHFVLTIQENHYNWITAESTSCLE